MSIQCSRHATLTYSSILISSEAGVGSPPLHRCAQGHTAAGRAGPWLDSGLLHSRLCLPCFTIQTISHYSSHQAPLSFSANYVMIPIWEENMAGGQRWWGQDGCGCCPDDSIIECTRRDGLLLSSFDTAGHQRGSRRC